MTEKNKSKWHYLRTTRFFWQNTEELNLPFIKTDFLLSNSLTSEKKRSFLEEYKIQPCFLNAFVIFTRLYNNVDEN